MYLLNYFINCIFLAEILRVDICKLRIKNNDVCHLKM